MQADVTELKEMREGFASIKSHMAGLVSDVLPDKRRIFNIEDELLRLKKRLGADDPDWRRALANRPPAVRPFYKPRVVI